MARKPLLAATGVLIALAAVSANPPHPALPPVPTAPGAPPVPPPNLTALVQPAAPPSVPTLPPVPPAGLAVPPSELLVPPAPQVPRVPADIGPVAPASPPPTQILEPVSAVHRFAGTYLGGTATRALVYAEADGKAEVLVYAVGGAKEPLARCAVPVDKPQLFNFAGDGTVPPDTGRTKQAFHDGRAFVLTARELTVVGLEGRVEWSFALPGRADNGERFVAVAGFDGANVLLASTDPKEGGRVYALYAETGKQVAFRKFEGGFRANALFAVNGPTRELYAASGDTVMAFNLDKDGAPAVAQLSFPTAHLTAGNDAAYVGVPNGLLAVKPPGDRATAAWFLQGGGIVPTAPGAFAMTSRGVHFYAPLRAAQGSTGHLSSFEASKRRESAMHWSIDVPKAISAPPVARGDSVYFVAGSVLYRANAATGAVYWKHTLALEANDALTGMTFDGDDLVAWGGGVVARVTDRGDPLVAPAPRERVRQVFHFGPGVFGSQ